MATARSSLEGQVVSIMRSLRQRGRAERQALARRLDTAGTDGLERMPGLRRITSGAREGEKAVPVPRRVPAGR